MREAREELGVAVATEKVWGILKPLKDMVSTSVVKVKYVIDQDIREKEFVFLFFVQPIPDSIKQLYFSKVSHKLVFPEVDSLCSLMKKLLYHKARP